jgi:hypothetical protein
MFAMMHEENPKGEMSGDSLYLEIWRYEQKFLMTRWTVATFFMSVSFAVFGFSFQENFPLHSAFVIRIFAVLIYWFAYILYRLFYQYTKSLRRYLIAMEKGKRTGLDMQSKIGRDPDRRRSLSTNGLLAGFGLVFTLGTLVLFVLGF